MRLRHAVLLLACAGFCCPLTTAAAAEQSALRFVEDFTSDAFCDTLLTTADWDTAAAALLTPFLDPFAVVGGWDSPGLGRGVALDGDRLLLCDNTAGLHVLDVSDPTAPVLLSTVAALNYAYDVDVEGAIAYLAEGSTGLRTVDLTDPAAPVVVGTYNTPSIAYSVDVDGDYAYVADGAGGLRVVNVRLPRTPVSAGVVATPSQARDVDVVGDLAYVAAYTSGLVVIDVSNPAAPAIVGSCDTPGTAYGVSVAGRFAYVADGSGGLSTIDVSNPASPVLTQTQDTSGTAWNVAAQGDRLYLADALGGLKVYGISDPAAPVLLRSNSPPGNPRSVALAGDLAYVADYDAGLTVVRIAEPITTPEEVAAMTASRLRWIDVEGGLAAVTAGAALNIYDVSIPWAPTLRGALSLPGGCYQLQIVGDLVFVVTYHESASTPGFRVIDISNPDAPVIVGQCSGFIRAMCLAVAGNYAYVGADNTLQVIDISDPTAPALVSSTTYTSVFSDICLQGNVALVANSYSGLRLLNITDPTAPTEITTIDTPGGATSIVAAGDYAYLGDFNPTSLRVYDITDPSATALVGTCSGVYGVQQAIQGDRLFAAHLSLGLRVVDIADPANPVLVSSVTTDWAMGVASAGDYVFLADDDNVNVHFRAFHVQRSTRYADAVGRSLRLNPLAGTVKQARVLAVTDGQVTTALSLDGGAHFTNVPGTGWFTPSTAGGDVRWRSTLDSRNGEFAASCSRLELDWRFAEPCIDDVADVPGDQGGVVRVRFTRAADDFATQTTDPITGYTLWRRVDDPAALKALATATAAEAEDDGVAGGPPLRRLGDRLFAAPTAAKATAPATASLPAGAWEVMGSFWAVQEEEYLVPATTLADSGETLPWSVYCVTAHTAKPTLWYASAPDSGYSVDNLVPGAPEGFMLAGSLLTWDAAPEPDFRYYTVYGSSAPDLDGTAVVIERLAGTALDVGGSQHPYYHLTATDFAGNESPAATAAAVTAVPAGPPARTALHPATPNPFNPRTRLRFDLAAPARATLAVYDLSGRRLRTLVAGELLDARAHALDWDGRDDAGRALAAGVYLVRLDAGAFAQTRRVVLVR